MSYKVSIFDRVRNKPVLDEAQTDRHGARELVTRFAGVSNEVFERFMDDLEIYDEKIHSAPYLTDRRFDVHVKKVNG